MSLRKAAKDSTVPLAQSITTASGDVVNEILIPADTIVIANSAGYNRHVLQSTASLKLVY